MQHGLQAHGPDKEMDPPMANDEAKSRGKMSPGPPERILALGQETPDRPAIEHGGRTVSYGELRALVLRASSELRRLGADAGANAGEDPVGVAMTPSIELVATVLAIQCAGFPYLPLPLEESPASRRDAILADGEPWLVIGDETHSCLLPGSARVMLWKNLVDNTVPAETEAGAWPEDDDLGYLIYTSGSTGTPKGVEMRWGALANLIAWQACDARLGRAARTALFTPLTFDVSFQEMAGTLVTGGTLVVLDPALRRDPTSLARALGEERIERLYLPFVALQSLAEAASAVAVTPTTLVDVITAGEQLKVTPEIRRFFASIGGAALHNHYGPAETHVVTTHTLLGDPREWPELPPIGVPVTGVQVLALDEKGVEAAPGVPGELLLGGECLARGYRNLPDETQARFVPDPRPEGAGLLYRTGDVGRRTADGSYEWIGRSDDQVKVRGHRVELGEVESVLSRHEGVRQIVVAPRESGASRELIAYVQGEVDAEVAGQAASETLETWRGIWDRTYTESGASPEAASDPTFDTSGWNSSLTGEPIPVHHMREWVDSTVERILALKPRRVLEVGCGTGLLLHRIAPHCAHYAGLDYSQPMIDRLSETLAGQVGESSVSLSCAPAHNLAGEVDEPVDLVVMNSVLQHFPSPGYLLDVLEAAISIAAPGGRIFVGDITPHGFREAFFTWLEAPEGLVDGAERAALRERVQRRLALDRELTLDPAFFDLLGAALPRVSRVEVQARKGRKHNELTNFRYDVILHLDRAGEPVTRKDLSWVTLDADSQSTENLVELAGSGLCVRGVPNVRTRVPWQRMDELTGDAVDEERVFLDPDQIYEAAGRRGTALEIRPDRECRTFSVGPPGACAPNLVDPEAALGREALLRRLSAYASNPLRERTARDLFPRLRQFAEQQLPDYMRPAAYVLLDTFPRTSSGKVDRRRLPSPGHRRPELSTSYFAPRTDLEKATERVWREVLELDRIGIDDSFFELGGNSIGVVTLAARLGRVLGREVPVLAIFEHPTVRSFAARLERPARSTAGSRQGARGALTRDAYRHRRNRRVSRG